MLNVITCADHSFMKYSAVLKRTAEKRSNLRVFVYDIDPCEEKHPCADFKFDAGTDFKKFDANNHIIANHKPLCVADFLKKTGRGCICIDSDCLLVGDIDASVFEGVDLCVTPRGRRENKPHILKNGLLNSGFMYFAYNDAVMEFIARWGEACAGGQVSDQKALSDILSVNIDFNRGLGIQKFRDINVKLIDPDIYNDVTCRTGSVFHCKSVARTKRKYIFYKIFSFLACAFPKVVDRVVRFNRKHRIFIYKRNC
ncbi:hypothetical protein GGQ74_001698 [Desulfobaculum xiamenense]|uniref:Nucleotide-diphospho-sugar transferase domain-containing protein n=1 Tax=Desulfobaculum xiamenense TaxID=995050 RepID=A0A846QRL1_9BACT|nr:putative nucleotide-diphospho-sugar transferase [Desulfobaculum xiamenense]NJB68025.1 hypothetical protein [Desulfobaculum xiamenense]